MSHYSRIAATNQATTAARTFFDYYISIFFKNCNGVMLHKECEKSLEIHSIIVKVNVKGKKRFWFSQERHTRGQGLCGAREIVEIFFWRVFQGMVWPNATMAT
jgi:hypothetical protein